MKPCKVCKAKSTCTMQNDKARRQVCFESDLFELDEKNFIPVITTEIGSRVIKINKDIAWVNALDKNYQFMNGVLVGVPDPGPESFDF